MYYYYHIADTNIVAIMGLEVAYYIGVGIVLFLQFETHTNHK